jgi:hypothetical protein
MPISALTEHGLEELAQTVNSCALRRTTLTITNHIHTLLDVTPTTTTETHGLLQSQAITATIPTKEIPTPILTHTL